MNWKRCKLILVFVFLFALLLGCATGPQNIIYPKVSCYSDRTDFSEYEFIAVLPFSDAPNAPGSGQIVQGLIIQQLAQSSFKVVERSHLHAIINEHKLAMVGITDQSQALELGKILGVRAIVVGEVGQYGIMLVFLPATTPIVTVSKTLGERLFWLDKSSCGGISRYEGRFISLLKA